MLSYILWGLLIFNSYSIQIVYEKENTTIHQSIQMRYLQSKAREIKIPRQYVPFLLGQGETESNWNDHARNSLGCFGTFQFCPQWNREFFARGAALDYRAQISEYLGRIKERLEKGYTIKQALIAHYSPRCAVRGFTKACTDYYRRVEKNSRKFKAKMFFKKRNTGISPEAGWFPKRKETMITFEGAVKEVFNNEEFMIQYRRLSGAKLGKGIPIEIMIDKATGYYQKEAYDFFNFVQNYIWLPALKESIKDKQ